MGHHGGHRRIGGVVVGLTHPDERHHLGVWIGAVSNRNVTMNGSMVVLRATAGEGWLNYYAVPGSSRFISTFLRRLQRLWMRALRRRSQRARFAWRRLERMTEILWPRASLRHPWPDQRFAVKHPR